MKTVTPELLNHLNTARLFRMYDLFEIVLSDGTIIRQTSYDQNITLPDNRKFLCDGIQFKRGSISLNSTIKVDKLEVTMLVDKSDMLSAIPIMYLIHNGAFDEASFTLSRVWLSETGSVIGTVDMFSGYIDIEEAGGLEVEMNVKSNVQRLNVDYPLRLYYPTCPYTVYDSSCKAVRADFTTAGAVTAVTSSQTFSIDIIKADSYYDKGVITFTSGVLRGSSHSVKKHYAVNNVITLLVAADSTPSIGDTFTIYPGCDKSVAMCTSKFNNKAHNRSTPYIPLKSSLV